MVRLVAEHFNQRGAPKRPFASKRQVQEYLAKTGQTGLYDFYLCSLCERWHLSTRKGKRGSRRFP